MIPPEAKFYAGVGAVAAGLLWSAFRLMRSRHRFTYRALLALIGLLVGALVFSDLRHSAGNVVIIKLFFALCGVALVAVIRLLWGAWRAERWGLELQLCVKPPCRADGTYRLGAVRETPTCSISFPGHTLDFTR